MSVNVPNVQDPVVIVGAARTPMGSFQSDFANLAAHDLGGVAIAAAVQRAGKARHRRRGRRPAWRHMRRKPLPRVRNSGSPDAVLLRPGPCRASLFL